MQLAELREYAGRRGWRIVEEFTDQGESGLDHAGELTESRRIDGAGTEDPVSS